MYGSFRKAFHNIRSALVEKLDVSHGLIDRLLQYGVLQSSHEADIRVSARGVPDWIFRIRPGPDLAGFASTNLTCDGSRYERILRYLHNHSGPPW